MALFLPKDFFLLRLLASLLLLSCMAPVSEAPSKQAVLASLSDPATGPLMIVIRKSGYTLTLYKGDTAVKTYRAAFGKGFDDGDKRRQGDKRTPEGAFYICSMNPSKRFYKFLGLSYPSLKHAEYGLQAKLITPEEFLAIKKALEERQPPPWDTPLGGAVGIHGRSLDNPTSGLSVTDTNWTDGCIALDNAAVDEIYGVVSLGTPVLITP